MKHRAFITFAVLAEIIALSACAGEGDFDILDAATVYDANQQKLDVIREYYPGPYNDFMRVPARDPAKETRKGRELIGRLRQSMPVEFIDFFPMGDTGKDEINVMLKRYGGNARWTVVSLVYSEVPLPPPTPGAGIALFDGCDARAREWFAMDRGGAGVSAFCRLNERWYAYQKVY